MTLTKENLLKYPATGVAICLLLLWITFGKTYPVLCTDGTRLATMESLVHRHTIEISDSMFVNTCDKFRIPAHGEGGKYYSDKPPVLTFIGAGVYYALNLIGLDIRKDLAIVYRCIDFVLVILPILFILYLMHLYLNAHAVPLMIQWWVYGGAILATQVLPFAMTIQNHVPAAALLLASYFCLENPLHWKPMKAVSLSGLALGLGISVDLNLVFFAMTFVPLILWNNYKKDFLACISYLVLLGLPILFTWYFFWMVTGKWEAFVSQVDLFLYQGSVIPRFSLKGGYDDNPLKIKDYLIYLWHATVGYKGLFSHSIALVFGFWGLTLCAKKENKLFLHSLAIFISLIVLQAFLMISVPITFGGSNFGFRYMVIWMPLVMLFSWHFYKEVGITPLVKFLFFLSVVTSSTGISSPWMIHKFNQIDLDNFDFLLASSETNNPYMQYEKMAAPHEAEIAALKSNLTRENLIKLGFIYYQLIRPAEAIGYLQLLGENDPEGNCYQAIIFSKRGLNHEDLFQRHVAKCQKEKWLELSKQFNIE